MKIMIASLTVRTTAPITQILYKKTPTHPKATDVATPVNVKAISTLTTMLMALMPQPSSEVLEEMAAIDPVPTVTSATGTLPVTEMWMELMPPSSNQTLAEMLVTNPVRPAIRCPGVVIRPADAAL